MSVLKRTVSVLSLLSAALFAAGTQAATFTVSNVTDGGLGSLRQAITDANTTSGADSIVFAIPGAGLHTITPGSDLPVITEAVLIDGYSQPGSSANTLAIGDNAVLLIELTGTGVSNGNGLWFTNAVDGAEVRGLVMTRWNNAITLVGAKNTVIDGNFLGTNAAGTAASSNSSAFFILSGAQNNTVGGPTAAARNLISGNTTAGLTMGNSSTSFNLIENNYIGTNASGSAAIGNLTGISLNGVTTATVRNNVISGNNPSSSFAAGIRIFNTSSDIHVLGNKIGVAANGTTALANNYGILLSDGFSGGANANLIGSQAEPNIIAFNAAAGVALNAFTSKVSRLNAILYNSIYSNGTLGIDLGDNGVTANDVGDGDAGMFNDLQNFPVLTSAQFGAATVTIAGSISSAPSSSYQVQFFQSTACDASGHGEGQTFLGEATVTTNASGVGAFSVTFPGLAGGVATATATDSLGNSSEFSACQPITTPAQPQISISDAAVFESNVGTTKLVFEVNLSAASAGTVSVDYTTADQTGSSSSDYAADSGTISFAPGETKKILLVTVNGDVTVEADETLLVNLTNPSGGAIVDNQGVGTILNDDGLPNITINDVTLAEGNSLTTSFDFTLSLSASSSFPVTVNYSTADATSVSPGDFQPASGVVTFAPGQTTKAVSVLVNGDNTTEPNETFVVNLYNPTQGVITDSQGLGTITNDDVNPTITINDPSVVEGNSGSTNMNFVITLSNPTSITLSVPFSLTNGTATVGSDYQTNSGSFSVFPGQTTASVTIGIFGDTTVEPDETFFMNLGNTAGATIGKPQGTGTIVNDDGLVLPGIAITDATVTEGNAGTITANFNVTLTASSVLTVTVGYATANSTATSGSDYVSTSGTVTFTPGQTSQPVSITVNGDTAVEANETFFVNLSTPTNATILDNQGLGTITNDDLATADLSITKTAPAQANANSNVTYTLTATNNGPQGATGVTVVDILPAGTTFVSAVPSQGSCSGTTTVTCVLGGLANGASATIALTIKMPSSAQQVVNTASVTAVENDPTPANGSAAATVAVGAAVATAGVPTLSLEALLLLAAIIAAVALTRMR
jgi:uncharacterized repeat protein (TIGR01451 family)